MKRRRMFVGGLALSRLAFGLAINEVVISNFSGGSYAPGGRGGNAATSLLRWDTGWYLGLANHWYPFERSTVFFPGYVVLVRLAESVTFHRLPLDASGLGVAWLAFLLSVPLVYAAIRTMCSEATTRLATALYVWSPGSVFLLSAYPEGAFVALSALTVLLISKDRLLPAALVAGIATAFSPLGVCLSVAVVVAVLPRRAYWRTGLYGAISISGFLAWGAWLAVRYGNPITFVTEQGTFNRRTVFPFSSLIGVLRDLIAKPPPGISHSNFSIVRVVNVSFELVALFVFLYYLVSVVSAKRRRLPLSFCVYSALALLIPAMSTQVFYGVDNPEAAVRLTTDSLGIYPVLAGVLLRRRFFLVPGLVIWIGLAAFCEALFVKGWYFT
ncbi:MAG: mannosyltransferase family protein [Acidimicrobiales bacterium]